MSLQDVWVNRILLQNGLAFFASWGTVAAIFNFAVVLTYRTGAPKDVGSTVSLTVFTLEIVGWACLDNYVFEKMLRYLFTPYLMMATALAGIISKNWDPTRRNSLYTLTLFIGVIILILIKAVLLCYRHKKRKKSAFDNVNNTKYLRQPIVSFSADNLEAHTGLGNCVIVESTA